MSNMGVPGVLMVACGILGSIALILWALSGPSTDSVIRETLEKEARFAGVRWEVRPFFGGEWVYLFGEVKTTTDAFELKTTLWKAFYAHKIKPDAMTDYGLSITDDGVTVAEIWNRSPGGPAPRPHMGSRY